MGSSLVVPAYNEEDVIEDTLDHLNELQPYFEEIYLVDDASTDSTQKLVSEYIEDHDTDVKVAYMRENGDKVGAIEEAVKATNTDNIVLTDADTRLETPEEIQNAEEFMDSNDYGALAFKVVPDDSPEGLVDNLWNKLQDFDYAMGRALADYTTGEKLRLDPDDKNVRCIAGAGGMYDREVLEEALEKHSGKHAGDDMETTVITQLLLDENVDYFSDVKFETEVPKEFIELKNQRTRWSRGSIQAFSEHPKEYIKEATSFSRYGQTVTYEAGITAAAPVILGKAAFDASQGDLGQAANTAAFWYGLDTAFTAGLGSYSLKKDEFEDNKTLALAPLMPAYRAATFFPAKIGSQAQTLKEKAGSESVDEFREGLEEGNDEFKRIRKAGKFFEKAKQKLEDDSDVEEWKDTQMILEDRNDSSIPAD